jgi:hypothetical protein
MRFHYGVQLKGKANAEEADSAEQVCNRGVKYQSIPLRALRLGSVFSVFAFRPSAFTRQPG